MLTTFQLVDGKVLESGAENACIYLYIGPNNQEKAHLINRLFLDEHTLQSTLDPEEQGRIEFEASHLAVILKRPKRYSPSDNFLFRISSLGLFLFPDKLIVVLAEDGYPWDGKIFSKVQTIQDAFLRIILHCIGHFEEHLRVIHKVSDELELEINRALSNKDLMNMFKLEKSLVYFLDAINSNNKVIEKLKNNSAKLGFSQESIEFLDDLMIEGSQCSQQINSYSQVLSNMMDAWASIINNNLNIRIKTLTILSLCIMTPTLIVSIFSMNVPLPVAQQGSLTSFWFVSSLALLSVAVVLLLWRFRRW